MVEIKIEKTNENVQLPVQANEGDAGFDVRSAEDKILRPYSISTIDTGLKAEIPYGYEIQVRTKSGMAIKEGLVVAQGVGTIDCGYRDTIKVLLRNITPSTKTISKGEQIAQLVVKPVVGTMFIEAEEVSDSERGKKGLGSTKESEQ